MDEHRICQQSAGISSINIHTEGPKVAQYNYTLNKSIPSITKTSKVNQSGPKLNKTTKNPKKIGKASILEEVLEMSSNKVIDDDKV